MSDLKTNQKQNPKVPSKEAKEAMERERYKLLQRLEDFLETPMLILAFVWLGLLVLELIWGESVGFQIIGMIIWGIFIIDFAVKLFLAPHKVIYLKRNWLTAISLMVPALRIFRIFRVFRVLQIARMGRSLRLLRVISSLNRGMGALNNSLQRRGFGYVLTLTVLVTFAGAAGMYAFEHEISSEISDGLNTYGEALWWTAMIMTTMGSNYWPESFEGRVLCIFLALYSFTVFGYFTATLATFFVGRDAENIEGELAGSKEIKALKDEVMALREDLRRFSQEPLE